jgi:hypothetical protein
MTMIEFDAVITVASGALPAMQVIFLLQLMDGRRIAAHSIVSEDPRRPIVRIRQSSFLEELGSYVIPQRRANGAITVRAASARATRLHRRKDKFRNLPLS